MAHLCVNIDHVATVRQARLAAEPDPVAAAVLVELAGAHGITVHLREDRRHIQDQDVERLRAVVKTKLNLEMAGTEEMVSIACRLQPDECTLVPEQRAELTTEGGLDVAGQLARLQPICARLRAAGITPSLFIDPEEKQISAAAKSGAVFVELHTGRYAEAETESAQEAELRQLVQAAAWARQAGLRLNAGHGLNYRNVRPVAGIAGMEDLNIGHSLVARAILTGLDSAVRDMLALIRGAECAA